MTAGGGVALGILAGGQGRRLGGADKAWLDYRGQPLILRLLHRLGNQVDRVIVSANRDPGRYRAHGLEVVADRHPGGLGPLAGIDALLSACDTSWLLTAPVDLRDIPADLVSRLAAAAGPAGAVACDDDGPQPLVALWRVAATAEAAASALANRDLAVHRLQTRLALAPVLFSGLRFGNLNTPEDFAADDR